MAKDKSREQPAHDDDEIRSDNSEFEVESIVGHKIDPEDEERVHYLYRIRWVGYREDDDTWEPKDSLEGGAEGILEDYVEARKNEGDVFFKEGYKRSKIQSYLDKHDIPYERLEHDAHPSEEKKKKSTKKSSTTSTSRKEKNGNDSTRMDEPSTSRANTSTSAAAFIEAEKEKKRKQRESLAAAENEEQNNKKSKRTSDSPLPPPLSKTSSSKHDRAEKENESQSNKPSSKRSTYEEDTSSQQQQHKKARSSVVQQQQDSDDEAAAAREMEQMKRSPLKEKKADQRKSEEPTASRSKPVSADKAALVSTSTPQKVVEEPTEQEEEELPLGSKIHENFPSWEGLMIVESLEQDISTPNKEGYKWFIRWIGNNQYQDEWISNNLARAKFPQNLLDFYEDHLKFKSSVDEDIDDAPLSENDGNPVNGDSAMD